MRETERRRVEESGPRARASIVARVASVVWSLPYLLVILLVSAPLVFATTWGSFFVYYDKAREAFADGRTVAGVANLAQILLLIVLIACVILTLVLAGRRLGTAVWHWSEGKPALRRGLSSLHLGFMVIAVVAAGVALFTWFSSDRSAADSSIKQSLEKAGSQVAILLGADSDTAHATPAEPADPEPEEFPERVAGEPAVVPQDEAKPDKPAATQQKPSGGSGKTGSDSATPAPVDPASNTAAPALEESTTDAAAPSVLTEEPLTTPSEPLGVSEPPEQTVPSGSDAPTETLPPDVPFDALVSPLEQATPKGGSPSENGPESEPGDGPPEFPFGIPTNLDRPSS